MPCAYRASSGQRYDYGAHEPPYAPLVLLLSENACVEALRAMRHDSGTRDEDLQTWKPVTVKQNLIVVMGEP